MNANASVHPLASVAAMVCLVLGLSFVFPTVRGETKDSAVASQSKSNSTSADGKGDALTKKEPPPLVFPFDMAQAQAARAAWAKQLGKQSPMDKNSIGMDLVLLPPGKCTIGSPVSEKDRLDNEAQVEVILTKAFYMAKTEVTQAQWQAVMGTTPWKGRDCVREGDNYAATYVSWHDALAFCEKLSEKENAEYRMPSEAEWEYACRAGAATRFSFGDDDSKLGDHAWWGGILGDGSAKDEQYAHEVGQKQANQFGLHDMHGNVWEWSRDIFTNELSGGIDPPPSADGKVGVCRGGGWNSYASRCRSAFRNRIVRRHEFLSGSRYSFLGFRVVRTDNKE
jgi:sulfatase modifying factor 1